MNFLSKKNADGKKMESMRGYDYATPNADLIETDKEYKIVFDLPGIDKKDIDIKVEKDLLTVTAESSMKPDDGYRCLSEEIGYHGYMRSFNLNNVVNTEKIDAGYKNGVLTLILPKKEETKSREIQIAG